MLARNGLAMCADVPLHQVGGGLTVLPMPAAVLRGQTPRSSCSEGPRGSASGPSSTASPEKSGGEERG